MKTFAQFINETYGSDRLHGIILPNGKVHEKFEGYHPDVHSKMAMQYGFTNGNDLIRKGGVRFAQYEGGANFEPGNRIEYDYTHPSAHKHIIAHIHDHPTSGGYSLNRKDGMNTKFTEHSNAREAIRHLTTKYPKSSN
jgi:hypothetical protein